jgi:hypothetical protein
MNPPANDDDSYGIGLYVINLESTSMPMPLTVPFRHELVGFTVFRSRSFEHGRECFRLYLGSHVLKENVIFGGVTAADRVRFVMNVSSGMLRMHDDLVHIRRVEMKHPRFVVIDPNGSVIVVRQDALRNGNFRGKESKQRRPTVRGMRSEMPT